MKRAWSVWSVWSELDARGGEGPSLHRAPHLALACGRIYPPLSRLGLAAISRFQSLPPARRSGADRSVLPVRLAWLGARCAVDRGASGFEALAGSTLVCIGICMTFTSFCGNYFLLFFGEKYT